MKAKYRTIQMQFWDDPYIQNLPPLKRYFYLFLFTNPYVKQCGVYEFSLPNFSHYSGLDKATIQEYLQSFIDDSKIRIVDSEIAILNFNKNNHTNFGTPVLDAIFASASAVKSKQLLWESLAKYNNPLILAKLKKILPSPDETWYATYNETWDETFRDFVETFAPFKVSNSDDVIENKQNILTSDKEYKTRRTTRRTTSGGEKEKEKEKESRTIIYKREPEKSEKIEEPSKNKTEDLLGSPAPETPSAEKWLKRGNSCPLRLYLPQIDPIFSLEVDKVLEAKSDGLMMYKDIWKRPDDFQKYIFESFFNEHALVSGPTTVGMIFREFTFWYNNCIERVERQYNASKKDEEWFDAELEKTNGLCKDPEMKSIFISHYKQVLPSGKLLFQTIYGFDVRMKLEQWVKKDFANFRKKEVKASSSVIIPKSDWTQDQLDKHYKAE